MTKQNSVFHYLGPNFSISVFSVRSFSTHPYLQDRSGVLDPSKFLVDQARQGSVDCQAGLQHASRRQHQRHLRIFHEHVKELHVNILKKRITHRNQTDWLIPWRKKLKKKEKRTTAKHNSNVPPSRRTCCPPFPSLSFPLPFVSRIHLSHPPPPPALSPIPRTLLLLVTCPRPFPLHQHRHRHRRGICLLPPHR